jgi:hypothetical protein
LLSAVLKSNRARSIGYMAWAAMGTSNQAVMVTIVRMSALTWISTELIQGKLASLLTSVTHFVVRSIAGKYFFWLTA